MIMLVIAGVILLLFLWYVLTPRKKDVEGHKLWNFNEKSWHARYYQWVIDDDLPQGGCIYFWAVLALCTFAPVIFIGYGIARCYMYIAALFPDRKKKPVKTLSEEEWQAYWKKKEQREKRAGKIADTVGKSLLIIAVLGVLVGLTYFFSTAGSTRIITVLLTIGFIFVAIGVMFFLGWLLDKIKFGRFLKRIFRPVGYPFRYLWSMIVAIYTNSCPKITWKKQQ